MSVPKIERSYNYNFKYRVEAIMLLQCHNEYYYNNIILLLCNTMSCNMHAQAGSR